MCNSLLAGLPDKSLKPLERIQKVTARIVSRCGKYDYITDIMKDLHWLPIKQRIGFKIIMLTFRSLYGLAPSYLCELVHWHVPKRTLRSGNTYTLSIPNLSDVDESTSKKFGKSKYFDRSFQYHAPSTWNMLPLHIRTCSDFNTFKSFLKTHLFKISYSSE